MSPSDGGKLWSARRGIIFLVVVFTVFMQAGLFAGRKRTSTGPSSSNDWISSARSILQSKSQDAQSITHPIPTLMARAEDKFRKLLSKQSKSLPDAVEEYKRRYGRDPPKGFDDWWQFSVKHKVIIIDEYDGLVEDLAPFWNLSGEELRRRTLQVGHLPSIDLVRLKDGNVTLMHIESDFVDSEVSARAKGFRKMIEKFQHKLPDMDFPINAKAEGRVLIPWDHREYPNTTHQDSSVGVEAMLGGEFKADWRGDGNVWESFRRVCPPNSQARRAFGSMRLNAHSSQPVNLFDPTGLTSGPADDFSFPETVDDRFSFCDNPWAHYQQGHFFSDWRTIPKLYPVFSPAKTPGYSDIRIPSHYYHNPTPAYSYGWDLINNVLKETDDMEVLWENKSDTIFWRGATTGGGSTPAGFAGQYQRHRFVAMTSDKSNVTRSIVFSDPTGSSAFTHAKIPIKEVNDEIMDVAFVRATAHDNYPGGRDALMRDHRFAQSVPLGEHWKYKYLVDFDGMGYSARLLSFLASDSAVIKSTVYLEYFSDWIQPWLHYIPLSQTYKEIYNLYAFFSGPTQSMLRAANSTALDDSSISRRSEDGDRRLRRIARAGKQWKQTIGRPIDMEAYVYRLTLEWARLWSDDRESMNYTL